MLVVVSLLGFGCNTSKPTPDLLAGFHRSSIANLDNNKTITDDYKDYIQKLSPKETQYLGPVLYFEDGTGQHAVRIVIGLNNANWEHVLIYDKNDKRIKAVKRCTGQYMS